MTKNPIICAVDTTDIKHAARLTKQLRGTIGAIKLGLEFFTAHGVAGVKKVTPRGMPVFLDLKFHDIPNTVAGAVRGAVSSLAPFIMTIHAVGGRNMMEAAVEAAKEASHKAKKSPPWIVGVTVLTSMDQYDIGSIGVRDKISDQVKRLADMAEKSGLDGVVCSAHEIESLRHEFGPNFRLIVPGIRPAGSDAGDQKRVMTPKEAISLGADYLVIGRPITGAADPKDAAAEILETL